MEEFGTDSFLVGPRRKMFPATASSVAKKMETVISLENVPFHFYCMFGNSPSFQALWLLIGVSVHGACFGMACYLVSAAVVTGPLGPLLLVSWLA